MATCRDELERTIAEAQAKMEKHRAAMAAQQKLLDAAMEELGSLDEAVESAPKPKKRGKF